MAGVVYSTVLYMTLLIKFCFPPQSTVLESTGVGKKVKLEKFLCINGIRGVMSECNRALGNECLGVGVQTRQEEGRVPKGWSE